MKNHMKPQWSVTVPITIRLLLESHHQVLTSHKLKNTLFETNIAPENRHLEKEILIGVSTIFRGELLVLGRVYHNLSM